MILQSNALMLSHHHQDGNLAPLLPCYYQPDFTCFMEKVGNLIPDGAVIPVSDFQFKYHETLNSFEVCTGIPVPTLYEAKPADFDILLNYLPLDHPSHPKNTENPSSLVHSCVSTHSNEPSLGNSPQVLPSTVNHHPNATRENANTNTFVYQYIKFGTKQCIQLSIKCSHPQPPSRQQYTHPTMHLRQ